MLSAMRNKKILNIFLWLVIFAFLATIVVVWGLGENQEDKNYLAKIDNELISYNEYSNAYDNTVKQMRQMYGNNPIIEELINSEFFGAQVLDDIIANRLLMEEAKRIKLPVSNVEIVNRIVQDPSFMGDDGNFDQIVYQETLKYYNLTPPAYEEQMRQEITLTKMRQLAMSAVAITEDEIQKSYTFENTNITASYFRVNTEDYISKDAIDSAALENYFKANAEKYRKAPQVKVKSISIAPADFDYKFEPSEQEVLARYNAGIASYTNPESVSLSQIVVSVEDWYNKEELDKAKEKIDAAAQELKNGKSFADTSKKYSDLEDDGKVGTIEKPDGELSELYEFIFALKDNEISEIYESDFGYHIFMVTDHKDKSMTSFDEVKDEIKSAMYDESFASAYRSHLYGKYRELMNAGNITAYVEKHPDEFTVEETALLSEDDPSAFFQYDQNVKSAIFALGLTEITPMLDFNGKTYIYELVERINSYLPELDEVRAQAEQEYRKELAFTAAMAAINNATGTEGMTEQEFANAAKQLKAKIEKTGPVSRMSPAIDVEWAQGASEQVYSSKANDVMTYPGPMGAYIYVIHTDKAEAPLPSSLDASTRSIILNELLFAKQTDALNAYVDSLRAKHTILINPSFTGRR